MLNDEKLTMELEEIAESSDNTREQLEETQTKRVPAWCKDIDASLPVAKELCDDETCEKMSRSNQLSFNLSI